MARLYGLNGIIRGRQGNNVYSVQNGTQVLKVYQPAVSNPRTIPQQEQRSKFSLAGKMSGATPSSALVGMPGSSPRARRAAFVASIVRNSSVSVAGVNVTASIPYANVLYSVGSLPSYGSYPQVTAEYGGPEEYTRVRVGLSRMTLASTGALAPEGYGEIAIVALYDSATSRLEEVQSLVRSQTTDQVVFFRLGQRRNVFVVVYVCPFALSSSAAALNVGNIEGSDTAASLLAAASSRLAGADWGDSIFVGVTPLLSTNNSMHSAGDDMRDVVEEALVETAVTPTVESRKSKK